MDYTNIVNMTPHTVKLINGDTVIWEFPSQGKTRAAVARTVVDTVSVGIYSFPVSQIHFGRVEHRPELRPGTYYIVSRIAAEAIQAEGSSTDDLLIPDDIILGSDGQPIGCRGFARL